MSQQKAPWRAYAARIQTEYAEFLGVTLVHLLHILFLPSFGDPVSVYAERDLPWDVAERMAMRRVRHGQRVSEPFRRWLKQYDARKRTTTVRDLLRDAQESEQERLSRLQELVQALSLLQRHNDAVSDVIRQHRALQDEQRRLF